MPEENTAEIGEDLAKIIRFYHRRGWYPARWAHHSPEIKAAIRRMHWRPQIKDCFANSQQFFMEYADELELKYREGWVKAEITMEHAWLIYRGKVLDLTLDPNREAKYLNSVSASLKEVAKNVAKTGF